MIDHFKTLVRFLPQVEPILYVQPFTVLSDEDFAHKFPRGPMTAYATPTGFWFCKTFWEGLPPNKQAGLILHEVMHPALGHLSDDFVDRSVPPHVFHQLANIAQDIVIERSIQALNRKIQPNLPFDQRAILHNFSDKVLVGYDDMTWIQAYTKLRDSMQRGGGTGEPNPFAICDISQARGASKDDPHTQVTAQRWQQAAEEMETIRQRVAAGSSAGGHTLDITPEAPVIPWQTHLLDYLVAAPVQSNKTWSRVQRRPFANRGEYRPVKAGTGRVMPMVNLLLDTSGSMAADYAKMAGEVLSICAIAQRVHRIDYDVGVAFDEVIEDPEDYTINRLHGGGGTCIRTAMEQMLLRQDFDRKAPCVVITDGGDSGYDLADLGVTCVFLTYGSMFKSDAGPVYEAKW